MTDPSDPTGAEPSAEIGVRGLRKRKVVATSSAETIGRIGAVHVDPTSGRVTSLSLRGRRGGRIPVDAVIAIGPDAVTVETADAVLDDDDPMPHDGDAVGGRLLDDAGRDLGKVHDLVIDGAGHVRAVVGEGGARHGPLLGIGSYAVVVRRA